MKDNTKKPGRNILFYVMSGLGIAIFSTLIFAVYGKFAGQTSGQGSSCDHTIVIDAGHAGEI